MDLQAFFVSKRGTRLAMWLGRNMPRPVGEAVVELGVRLVSRNNRSPLVQGIRVNQSVARGLPTDAPELDQVVPEVLRNAGRGYYDLYHRVGQGREAVAEAVTFAPELVAMVQQNLASGRGTMLVGPHLGNFDLAMLAFAASDYAIQAISYGVPPGGYELQNRMRADAGYIVTPASGQAARAALQRLRAGGVVATGIDRPPPNPAEGELVTFFGRPTHLFTGYARLALSTDADLLMIKAEPTGNSRLHVGPVRRVELARTGNRKQDARLTAESALAVAEEWIRCRPSQWMLFHPIWPELMQ
jgi:KDO2-lipid IV(A) lauroyltransferase